MNKELEYLKKHHPEKSNNLELIHALKAMSDLMTPKYLSPKNQSEHLVNLWHQSKIFAMAQIHSSSSDRLLQFHNDMHKLFSGLADQTALELYMYADFPINGYDSIMAEMAENTDIPDQMREFTYKLSQTHLGYYEVILVTGSKVRLKDIMTGEVFEAIYHVDPPIVGNLILCRLYPQDEKIMMVFGDAHEFPASGIDTIRGMIEGKMFQYQGQVHPIFQGEKDEDSRLYKSHMKLSGAYWLSFMDESDSMDIMPIFHWKDYLPSNRPEF